MTTLFKDTVVDVVVNIPHVICCDSFQNAWAKAVLHLACNEWDTWNLIVQIKQPNILNEEIHSAFMTLAGQHTYLTPDQVAYTIFPFKLHQTGRSHEEIIQGYKRFRGKSRSKPKYRRDWGRYFERMTEYPMGKTLFDQLGTIIQHLNERKSNIRSQYYMIIPSPGKDTNLTMGGPCLNYVALQIGKDEQNCRSIGMLAVYRNHYFCQKAYGNYYGLSKLLEYIACKTNSAIGTLTCVSSHACVQSHKRDFKEMAMRIEGVFCEL